MPTSTLCIRNLEELKQLPQLLREMDFETVNFKRNLLAENFSVEELEEFLDTTYPLIRQRFECTNVFSNEGNSRARINTTEFVQTMGTSGWDEVSDFDQWEKPFAAKMPSDFSYLGSFKPSRIKVSTLDPYEVYNRVLGGQFSQHDEWMRALLDAYEGGGRLFHWIELMSGTAKAALGFTHSFPGIQVSLIDLDPKSFDFHSRYVWGGRRESVKGVLGDVLDPRIYRKLQRTKTGPSISFVGKQSVNFFDLAQLQRLFANCVTRFDHAIFELGGFEAGSNDDEDYDYEVASLDKLGIRIGLDSSKLSNPVTGDTTISLTAGRMGDPNPKRRRLFDYEWHLWQPFAVWRVVQQMGLRMRVFNFTANEWRDAETITNKNWIVDDASVNLVDIYRPK